MRALRKAVLSLMLAGAAIPAAADAVVIAMLGDSLTQGYGLPPRDGLVPRMKAWLEDRGHEVDLINAGVSGDTSAGGLARLDWTLTPEVDALVVELGANDMLRGIDPAVTRANLDSILSGAVDRGLPVLLVGVKATGNYGPDYKAAFDAIYPDLAQIHGARLYPDFFAPLVAADDGTAATRGRLIQPDGLHPTAAGVALVVEALGPQVEALIPE